jgi:hypothetical protein
MRKVWIHRSIAALWLIFGLVVWWPLGWQDSVALVWMASVFANVYGPWTASEAADDHTLTDRLDRIEQAIKNLRMD